MTASQHLEMLVTKRPPSDLPVRVVEQLTRRRVAAGYPRVVVGHLAQANLAALAVTLAGLSRRIPAAPAVAFIALCLVAGDAALAGAIGLGEMPWRWSRRDLGIDLMHKTSLRARWRGGIRLDGPGRTTRMY
jgi:hypothetical protein